MSASNQILGISSGSPKPIISSGPDTSQKSSSSCCGRIFKHWGQSVGLLESSVGITALGSGFAIGSGAFSTSCSATSVLILKWGLVSGGAIATIGGAIIFFVTRQLAIERNFELTTQKVSAQVAAIGQESLNLKQTVSELTSIKVNTEEQIGKWQGLEEASHKASEDSKAALSQLAAQLLGEQSASEEQRKLYEALKVESAKYVDFSATLQSDLKLREEQIAAMVDQEKQLKESLDAFSEQNNALISLQEASKKESDHLQSTVVDLQEKLQKNQADSIIGMDQMREKEQKLLDEMQLREKQRSELWQSQNELKEMLKEQAEKMKKLESLMANASIQKILLESKVVERV